MNFSKIKKEEYLWLKDSELYKSKKGTTLSQINLPIFFLGKKFFKKSSDLA